MWLSVAVVRVTPLSHSAFYEDPFSKKDKNTSGTTPPHNIFRFLINIIWTFLLLAVESPLCEIVDVS